MKAILTLLLLLLPLSQPLAGELTRQTDRQLTAAVVGCAAGAVGGVAAGVTIGGAGLAFGGGAIAGPTVPVLAVAGCYLGGTVGIVGATAYNTVEPYLPSVLRWVASVAHAVGTAAGSAADSLERR